MAASRPYPKIGPGEEVEVDSAACARVASLLKTQSIPADKEDVLPVDLARPESGNFYLLLVAICHQTSPRGRPPLEGTVGGKRLRGWDYLSAKLAAAVRDDPRLLKPTTWVQFTPQDVADLFTDPKFGKRLTDPEGRARLVRNLGAVMHEHGWLFLEDLYRASKGRIGSGYPNLLALLATFDAYKDPVQKKALLLLAIMRNSGLWSYKDEENLGPPVDYHEIRGHLRIGTVTIKDQRLKRKLLINEPVTEAEDLAIRGAVRNAIELIAQHLGARANPSVLHYLFWNVFRSCCTHQSPHCVACPPTCHLPERYVSLAVRDDGSRRCPFSDVCESANSAVRLQEHVLETDYY